MAVISDELKKAISEILPAFVASASKEGKPNVSPKGSVSVLDDEHVIFADIRSPGTVKNLKENPYVSMMSVNLKTRNGWRIWGKTVEIMTSGEVVEKLNEKYASKGKVNHVVKILVEKGVVF